MGLLDFPTRFAFFFRIRDNRALAHISAFPVQLLIALLVHPVPGLRGEKEIRASENSFHEISSKQSIRKKRRQRRARDGGEKSLIGSFFVVAVSPAKIHCRILNSLNDGNYKLNVVMRDEWGWVSLNEKSEHRRDHYDRLHVKWPWMSHPGERRKKYFYDYFIEINKFHVWGIYDCASFTVFLWESILCTK